MNHKTHAFDDTEFDENLVRYVQLIVDTPMPPGVRHVQLADLHRPRRRGLGKQVLGSAITVVSVVIAVIVVLAVHHSQAPTGAPATTPVSSPTPASLSATLVLQTRTVKAGGGIQAQVVVENRTGHEIDVPGCRGIFEVLLTSSSYHPTPSFLQCLELIRIPVGQTNFPVVVTASYARCGMLGPFGDTPACLPTGSPPLPPGEYAARTFESGNAVPVPLAVDVRVT